jgi:hypothetical protein
MPNWLSFTRRLSQIWLGTIFECRQKNFNSLYFQSKNNDFFYQKLGKILDFFSFLTNFFSLGGAQVGGGGGEKDLPKSRN